MDNLDRAMGLSGKVEYYEACAVQHEKAGDAKKAAVARQYAQAVRQTAEKLLARGVERGEF